MTNQETIANLNMISVAFVEPVTKEQRKLIDDTFDNAIKALEQEPKTGHWITKDSKEQGYDIGGVRTWYIQIMCDKCGFIKTAIEGHTGQYSYCPNCGAKMVEQESEE